jgi:hypothetical protein
MNMVGEKKVGVIRTMALMPSEYKQLEMVVDELVEVYLITGPPIRVEQILQRPKPGMGDAWQPSKMSSSFIEPRKPFGPRMALARWLARQVASSPWGVDRKMDQILTDEERIHIFARILLMPRPMVMALQKESRTVETLTNHFQVPPEEAEMRLDEINFYT